MSEIKDYGERHPIIGCTNEDIKRFWSKVSIGEPEDCWEWQGGLSNGYGNMSFTRANGKGTKWKAHRFSFAIHNPDLIMPECVCHACDNPKCCNPHHLWPGTRADNNADMVNKGRNKPLEQAPGEGNTNAILSTPEVLTIRVMARLGMPQASIARYLGVSKSLVCTILRGDRRSSETEESVSACVNAMQGRDPAKLDRLLNLTRALLNAIKSQRNGGQDVLIAAVLLEGALAAFEGNTPPEVPK